MRRLGSLLLCFLLLLSACSGGSGGTWQEQYELGMKYLEEGNYESAILAFQAAIDIDPKKAESYLGLAEVYLAQSDREKATEVLTSALSVVNDSAVQAKLDELNGPGPDASSGTEDGTQDWQHEYDRGMEYLQNGDYQSATEAFQTAIDLDALNAEAYLALADAYIGLGDTEQAVQILREALNAVSDPTAIQAKLDELAMAEPWKKAYSEYIGNLEGADGSGGQVCLAYIDGDDIPELYIQGGDSSEGTLCTFTDGTISEGSVYPGTFSYLERQNLFSVICPEGEVDYERIYTIQNGQFDILHEGGVIHPGGDLSGHTFYLWDGEQVSSEAEYNNLLNGTYDESQAIQVDSGSLLSYGEILPLIRDTF